VAEFQDCDTASFAGWVPTTSGHLSFSAIGRHLPSETACFNNFHRLPNGAPLGVAVVQTRTNRDVLWPFRPLGRWLGASARARWPNSKWLRWLPEGHRFHFFLIASPEPALAPYFDGKGKLCHRPDSRGALRGTVYWFAGAKTFHQRLRDQEMVREVSTRLHSLNVDPPAGDWDWIESWKAEFEKLGDAKLDFVLYRTGELRLSGSLGHYHGTNKERIESRMAAARHAYYFIKDCAHHHHHHHPTDDQLLPLVPLADPTLSEDAHWRREVLWALTRVIGQFRRESGHAKHRQALGVIAYAEAFQLTLARVRRPPGAQRHVADESLATFNFGQQRASIEVSKEVENWRRQGRFSLSALAIASVISLVSLWAASARFARELGWGEPHVFLMDLPKAFYLHYELFLLVVLSVIAVVYDRTYRLKSWTEGLVRVAFGWLAARHNRKPVARLLVPWGSVLLVAALWGFVLGLWP
jgi:hypothetical protein